jgi:hypothetical protein
MHTHLDRLAIIGPYPKVARVSSGRPLSIQNSALVGRETHGEPDRAVLEISTVDVQSPPLRVAGDPLDDVDVGA